MTQGERIRELRKTLKMTMEQFGEKIGVTKSTISNIENGNRNATEHMVKSIAVNLMLIIYGWLLVAVRCSLILTTISSKELTASW